MKTGAKIGIGAATAATVAFVVMWEGNEMKPYLDVGGVPTVCAGVTKGVSMDLILAPEECAKLNGAEIQRHADELSACIKVPLSEGEKTAYISWAYNVGTRNACQSTLVQLLNQEKRIEACHQLPRWNKVNQKEIRGLTNRRLSEMKECLNGVKKQLGS
jgi:lysozyme